MGSHHVTWLITCIIVLNWPQGMVESSQIALRAIISCLKHLKVQTNALEAAHDQGHIRNFSDLWTPPPPYPRYGILIPWPPWRCLCSIFGSVPGAHTRFLSGGPSAVSGGYKARNCWSSSRMKSRCKVKYKSRGQLSTGCRVSTKFLRTFWLDLNLSCTYTSIQPIKCLVMCNAGHWTEPI